VADEIGGPPLYFGSPSDQCDKDKVPGDPGTFVLIAALQLPPIAKMTLEEFQTKL
jgi:hypothetical protein